MKLENYTDEVIESTAYSFIESVENGEENALEMYIFGKALQKIGETISKNIITSAITEASKHTDKNLKGATFEVKYNPTTYDFENDKVYNGLAEALKIRKDLLNEALKSKGIVIDEDSGEQIPKVPVKKHGDQNISVSFKSKK